MYPQAELEQTHYQGNIGVHNHIVDKGDIQESCPTPILEKMQLPGDCNLVTQVLLYEGKVTADQFRKRPRYPYQSRYLFS